MQISESLQGNSVSPHPVIVSAQTTRVPVIDGHTESISVGLDARPRLPVVASDPRRTSVVASGTLQ